MWSPEIDLAELDQALTQCHCNVLKCNVMHWVRSCDGNTVINRYPPLLHWSTFFLAMLYFTQMFCTIISQIRWNLWAFPFEQFCTVFVFLSVFLFARVVLGQLECIHCGKYPPLWLVARLLHSIEFILPVICCPPPHPTSPHSSLVVCLGVQ